MRYSKLSLALALSVPVGEKLLETDVGQRMFNQLLIDTIGHRAAVSSLQGRFYNMHQGVVRLPRGLQF